MTTTITKAIERAANRLLDGPAYKRQPACLVEAERLAAVWRRTPGQRFIPLANTIESAETHAAKLEAMNATAQERTREALAPVLAALVAGRAVQMWAQGLWIDDALDGGEVRDAIEAHEVFKKLKWTLCCAGATMDRKGIDSQAVLCVMAAIEGEKEPITLSRGW